MAGEGAGDYTHDTNGANGNWCHRSPHALVHHTALATHSFNLACSGADSTNVSLADTTHNTEGSQARRLTALAKRYRVTTVLVQVGANDAPQFAETVVSCVLAWLNPFGKGCREDLRKSWPSRLNAMTPKVETALRDIRTAMRKRDGGFLLITTDAKMHNGPSWDHAQRHGSRNIVIWESPDLVTWSAPRLAEVGDDTVGNVWAPEVFYDPATRRHVVFWASNLYPRTDPQHTGPSYNRVLYSTTTDFRTFSPQRVWIDPGHAVIDTTVVTDRGQFFRFTKDEREQSQAPCGKFVFQERGRSFFGPYGKVADCLGRGDIAMGEGATLFQDNNSGRWHMHCDRLVVLRAGKVVATGRPEEVLTAELIGEVYGVRAEVTPTGVDGRPHVRYLGVGR